MMFNIDNELATLFGIYFILLITGTLFARFLKSKDPEGERSSVVDNLNARMKTWWLLIGLFFISAFAGFYGFIALFALVSILAMREFFSVTKTCSADHVALLTAFLVAIPVQYALISMKWYGLFTIFIPVYIALVIPIQNVLQGDIKDFLSRTARIQWSVLLCVYFISHAPALLMLDIGNSYLDTIKMLCFLATIVQVSDVSQYIVGKLFGKKKLIEDVSPNKTMEGFLGGILVASVIGGLLSWLTPFTVVQAMAISLIVCLLGTAGDLVMSAIKRDSSIKDFSSLLPGHGGMLDRVDSLCFAAPVFFHISRYFFV